MSAWQKLCDYDGSDEFLALCSDALADVQQEYATRMARRIRAFAEQEDGHLRSTSATVYVQGIRDAADLIDPEVKR